MEIVSIYMGIRELAAVYGDKKGSQLMNDAIRAEIPGGDEILDALNLAPQVRAGCIGEKKILANKLFNLLLESKKKMELFIAEKYELKSRRKNHE